MTSLKILGTSITCFDVRQRDVEELQHLHRLFHHQRHRSIKHRQDRRAVSHLLHGVPLNPLQRTRHSKEPVWPGATELQHADVVEVVVPRAGLLGVGVSGTRPCSASRTPAQAIVCPRGACVVRKTRPGPSRRSDARAVATV